MKTWRRPLERHLEVYEEEWKRDHDEAMRCRDYEERLALGVVFYEAIEAAYTAWRADVARGDEELRADDERSMKGLFERWVQISEQGERYIADYERRFGEVQAAPEFRATAVRAKRILGAWTTPKVQQAPGLRTFTLTEAEAETLEGELPRLTVSPRAL